MDHFNCHIAELPSFDLALRAAKESVEMWPGNEPPKLLSLLPPDPAATVFMTGYRWGDKVRLPVKFLGDKWTARGKKFVLDSGNKWGDWGNIQVWEAKPGEVADVRISYDLKGYFANLGNQCRLVPPNLPTMNLEGFFDLASVNSTVMHEWGHIYGFHHAHLHPKVQARLDPVKTRAYMKRMYGWSDAQTDFNVLVIPQEAWFSPTAETRAVMQYGLPGECTYDGLPILGGDAIDPDEGGAANRFYPGAITRPPGVYPFDVVPYPEAGKVMWWNGAGRYIEVKPFPGFGGEIHVSANRRYVFCGAGKGGGPHGVAYDFETGVKLWERNPIPGFQSLPTGCVPCIKPDGGQVRWSGQGGLVVEMDPGDWNVKGSEVRYNLPAGVNVRSIIV